MKDSPCPFLILVEQFQQNEGSLNTSGRNRPPEPWRPSRGKQGQQEKQGSLNTTGRTRPAEPWKPSRGKQGLTKVNINLINK